MNLRELESLLAELMQAAQEILASGEQLDDAFLGELANEIEATQAHIQQLQSQQTPEQSLTELAARNSAMPQTPPLEPGMPSSNVNSFAYDPDNEQLYVKFQGDYPLENGPTYKYGGVPEPMFEAFRQGAIPARTEGTSDWGDWWVGKKPSLGASFYSLIRESGFPYERLSA